MSKTVREGDLLWTPSKSFSEGSELARYMQWLATEKRLSFPDYASLWKWSVSDLDAFWSSIAEFFSVPMTGRRGKVLAKRQMPGAEWFPGVSLNYASQLDHYWNRTGDAVVGYSEVRKETKISWKQLRAQVGSVRTALEKAGVKKGDRVVAYLPNIPEAVVAFLATASLGAIWSSTSPDFGSQSVIDRFQQIEPKVLLTVDGYRYGGKDVDRLEQVRSIRQYLPSLSKIIFLPYLNEKAEFPGAIPWEEVVREKVETSPTLVPFNHPLWILFSSGTTGLPKPIVQGHGGILLEHLKALALHLDVKAGDWFSWWTTTGWMMWNFLVGGLLHGSTIVLYDGSPGYPEPGALFDLADRTRLNILGAGAAYYSSCMKAGLKPREQNDLRHLRAVGSTGSPLSPEAFQWLYQDVKQDLWVVSLSGGTDLCTAFLGGSPLLPVRAGELQCRSLGASVYAATEDGQEVVDQVGELVITAPMPSMPLYFWNDPEGARYRASYFDLFPGIWRHGDWIKITPQGSAVILGRSDATLKKKGVRMGTSEIYHVVDALPEVIDNLVVGVDLPDGEYYMPLLVTLKGGTPLTPKLEDRIREKIRKELSSRHVPDEIIAVRAIPRTLNGKKLEVPLRKILMGVPIERALNPGSVTDPSAVLEIAETIRKHLPKPQSKSLP